MATSVIFAAATAAAGAFVAYIVHLIRERARMRRARERVAHPRLSLATELDGELASVSGVLGSDSPGLAAVTTSRFTSDPLATTTRATDLHIAVGSDVVVIDDNVEVILGSEEIAAHLSSNLIIGSRRGLTRSLRPGDLVVATGRLCRSGDFAGYRAGERATWAITGAGDSGSVSLTSQRRPRVSAVDRRHLVAGATIGLWVALLASSGGDIGLPDATNYVCQARIAPTPDLPMIGDASATRLDSRQRPEWLPEAIVCSSEANPESVISLDLSGEEAWKITAIPRAVRYDAGIKARLGFAASLGRVTAPQARLSQQLLLPLLPLRSPGLQ